MYPAFDPHGCVDGGGYIQTFAYKSQEVPFEEVPFEKVPFEEAMNVDPALLVRIGDLIAAFGGRGVLVGGCVRDRLCGRAPKDFDIEVFGLDAKKLKTALEPLGPVKSFGASYPVQHVRGLPIDFTLARGHDFTEAARHRDLTINSMGQDLITGALLDPYGGQQDLAALRLRATDLRTFGKDPLRGLRVCQLAARFGMQPDAQLVELCQGLELSAVAPERLMIELQKMLLMAPAPSVGLELLRRTHLLRFFPRLAALVDVQQNPQWHPEGDVWVHTLMVVDEAARLRCGDATDLTLMFAALLHDIGKPGTTREVDGRLRSTGHDVTGEVIAAAFLLDLKAPTAQAVAVRTLVRHHLAPAVLGRSEAPDKAYRRIARLLSSAGLQPQLLSKLARADHLGRTTDAAKQRAFASGDTFDRRIAELGLQNGNPDVVLGRHLLAHNHAPGPQIGRLLDACRDVQDATGWTDPEMILKQVLQDLGA